MVSELSSICADGSSFDSEPACGDVDRRSENMSRNTEETSESIHLCTCRGTPSDVRRTKSAGWFFSKIVQASFMLLYTSIIQFFQLDDGDNYSSRIISTHFTVLRSH